MKIENLINYNYLLNDIQKVSDEYAELFTKATRIVAGGNDSPQSSNRDVSLKVENYAIKLVEVKEKLENLIREKNAIENRLEKIDFQKRYILEEHYIKGKTIKRIAGDIGKSYKYVITLKTKALKTFKE